MNDREDDPALQIVPFREVLDTDPDRGIAMFTQDLRLVYANPSARSHLVDPSARDANGALPPALRDALIAFRSRLERSENAPAPAEVPLGVDGARKARAVVTYLTLRGTRWFVVRFSPPGAFAEPTLRRLQMRFGLTLREAEVALDVTRGRTNAEVAHGLGISEKTVKNALMSVFVKCDVRNRVELALRAHDAPTRESLPGPQPFPVALRAVGGDLR